MENYDTELEYLMKIIIVGDSGVGKTNLLERYIKNEFFESNRNTVGVDFMAKKIQLDKHSVKIQFWDTAGQEKYKSISSAYYKSTQGVILVYDVTNRASFLNIGNWLKDIKEHTDNDIQYLLVGNKTDLSDDRQLTQEEAKQYAEATGLFFMEVSAKSNENQCVNLAFETLFKEILKRLVEKDEGFIVESVESEQTKKRMTKQKLIQNSKILDNNEVGGLKKESSCCGI